MRYLIFPILFLLTSQAIAQSSRIKLGVQFGYETVSADGYIQIEKNALANRIEREDFNFSTGITANFLTNSSFSFQSGLLYSQKDIIKHMDCPVCFWQNSYWYLPIPIEVKQRFLAVPFLVRYEDKGAKLSPILEAGIYNNFIVSDNDSKLNKSAFMEGAVGLGASYKLNQKMRLELKYSYRKAITTVYHGEAGSWNDNGSDPNDLKTQSFQLGFNYRMK